MRRFGFGLLLLTIVFTPACASQTPAPQPTVTAKELMDRLAAMVPDAYAGKAQLRTLQRRVKAWRAEKAKDLILGRLRQSPTMSTTP